MEAGVFDFGRFVRSRLIAGLSVGAGLIVVTCLWFLRSPAINTDAVSAAKLPATAESFLREQAVEATISPQSYLTGPTERERQVVSKYITAATSLLRACENANSATVFDREYEGQSRRTILKIAPPTTEQMSAVYEDFSRGISELQAAGIDDKRFRREIDSLTRDYANYPKTSKIVSIVTFSDPKTAPRVREFFANDESEYLPAEDGSFVIPTDPYYRLDEDFGGKESWAAKRYSHLISIER